MTRSDPDPVFEAAARAELVRRVQRHRRPGRAPGRRLVRLREVVVVSLVVVAAAAVLVGVQQFRQVPHEQGASPAASAPPTRSATPTPTPSTPTRSALIGPPTARFRTSAEITSWAEGIGATSVWAEQRVIIAACMAQHGYLYDPIEEYSADLRAGHSGMSAADEAAFDEAEHGPTSSGAYDWRTAGCDGLAVHETGMDGQD